MSTEKSKGFITIAGLLSGLALTALAGGVYLGRVLDNHDQGEAMAYAIAVLVVGALAAWGGAKAKAARNDFKRNGRLKYFCIFIMLAVLGASIMPFTCGVNYYINVGTLRVAADNDIELLKVTVSKYLSNEQQRLNSTVQGLENFRRTRPTYYDMHIDEFIQTKVMSVGTGTLSTSAIELYKDKQEREINNERIQGYMRQINDIVNDIDRWDMILLPSMGSRLATMADTLSRGLTSMSRGFVFPIIGTSDDNTGYGFDYSTPYRYTIKEEGQLLTSECDGKITFGDKYKKVLSPGYDALGVFAIVAFFYLLNFLLVCPSNRRPTSKTQKRSANHGIPL